MSLTFLCWGGSFPAHEGGLQDGAWPPASSLGSPVRGWGHWLCTGPLLQSRSSPASPLSRCTSQISAHLCAHSSPRSLPPPPQLSSPPGPGCQSPALAVSPVSQPSRPGPLSPLLTPGPRTFLGDSSVIPLRSPLWRSKNTGLQRGLQADGRKANPAQASRHSPDSAHHR